MNRPLDVLLHHMRISSNSHDEWEANFAQSILKQAKRKSWKPSQKQTAIMNRLVSESLNETELEVLEEY